MNHLIILTYCRLYVVYHISYVVIYRYIIYIYLGGFANYLLTCLLNLQNVSHIPRV